MSDILVDIEKEVEPLTEESNEALKEETSVTPSVPEKFKGKSIEDVLESYKHLESELGRSRNEIGELRSFTDTLLKRDLQAHKKQSPEETEEDFFDNPKQAISKAVEEALNKRLAPVENELAVERNKNVLRQLTETHPDAMLVVASEEFKNWVQESPVRKKLYEFADKSHDLDSANELLGTFKALYPAKKEPKQKAVVVPPPELESPGGGESSKKIWRRLDLMRMRTHDLEKYMSLQDEILEAYREGRVK